MKLIEWSELSDGQLLLFGHCRRKRRLDPVGEVRGAIVFAHSGSDIGHKISKDHCLMFLLAVRAHPAGTRFLEAFQSCRLMKLGAMRRINASRLACPGRTSSLPALNPAKDCLINSSVVIRVTPSPSE